MTIPDLPVALIDNPVAGLGKLNEAKLALYIGLSQGQTLLPKLEALLQQAGINVSSQNYQNVEFRLVTVPYSPVLSGYATIGDVLVIALNETTLRAAVDTYQGRTVNIEQAPGYKKALETLNHAPGTQVGYFDIPRLLTISGNLGLGYAESMKSKGQPLPVDLDTLPKLEEITALIPPLISGSINTPQGAVAEHYSPFGYLGQVALSGGANLFQEISRKKRRKAQREARKEESHQEEEAAPSHVKEEPKPMEPASTPSEGHETDASAPGAEGADKPGTSTGETPLSPPAGAQESEKAPEPQQTKEVKEPVASTAADTTTVAAIPDSTGAQVTEPGSDKPIGPPASPEGWSVSSSSETMVSYLSADYKGTVNWLKTPYSPHMQIEAMLNQVKSASASTEGFKVVREGALSIGGLSGAELVYELGPDGGRQRIRLIYLQDGANLYTLSMQCAVNACEAHQPAFQRILDSLK